jgi:hypothetical protein
MEGAGGIVSTYLPSSLNDSSTTITVASTNGFLSSDYIVIEKERVLYTGTTSTTFTGCTRGYDGTDAVAHAQNARVYGSETSVVNNALGFNIATTAATAGAASIIMIPYKFFTTSVPRMITFDYSFFTGQLVYVQVFFQVIGGAFAVTMAILVVNTLMGILRPA